MNQIVVHSDEETPTVRERNVMSDTVVLIRKPGTPPPPPPTPPASGLEPLEPEDADSQATAIAYHLIAWMSDGFGDSSFVDALLHEDAEQQRRRYLRICSKSGYEPSLEGMVRGRDALTGLVEGHLRRYSRTVSPIDTDSEDRILDHLWNTWCFAWEGGIPRSSQTLI